MPRKMGVLSRPHDSNAPGGSGRSFRVQGMRLPFWLGQDRDPEKVQETVNTALKWEEMTKTCRDCGKVALYRVKMIGYCKEHYAEAVKSARAAKGLK